jgi:hypothetical protein
MIFRWSQPQALIVPRHGENTALQALELRVLVCPWAASSVPAPALQALMGHLWFTSLLTLWLIVPPLRSPTRGGLSPPTEPAHEAGSTGPNRGGFGGGNPWISGSQNPISQVLTS